jgi:hypothetical protein
MMLLYPLCYVLNFAFEAFDVRLGHDAICCKTILNSVVWMMYFAYQFGYVDS